MVIEAMKSKGAADIALAVASRSNGQGSPKDLAREATPLPPAEPPRGAVRYGRRR